MNILFNSTKVKYENGEYIEVPEENDILDNEEIGEDFNPYEENEEIEQNEEVEENQDDVDDQEN